MLRCGRCICLSCYLFHVFSFIAPETTASTSYWNTANIFSTACSGEVWPDFCCFSCPCPWNRSSNPPPLYIYSLLLYFLIPILLALAPLLPLYLGNKKKGITEPAASEIPFIGFFTSCNMAIYFIYHNDYGQFFPLFLPLFYLISIPVLAKILWHWRRLNLHWNLISLLLLATILCLVPLVYLFHSMLRPLLAWGIAAGILSFYLLFNKFLNNLEQGIGFRLNIEMKVGSLFHSK